tara:strand:+ start:1978 stop:2511 length:534 start_codon:yes stop_codon:yes gene_type:complete
MNIDKGWIEEAKILKSPNFDERNNEINLIVIHSISLPPSKYGSNNIDNLFLNKLNPLDHPYFKKIINLKVSSHFLIERTGVLKQFVSTEDRAWHAGESSFKGEDNCNDFSIGIELEGTEYSEFEKAQYSQLIKLTQTLMKKYPKIKKERIVAHSLIAPGRKLDPGKFFDWEYFKSEI